MGSEKPFLHFVIEPQLLKGIDDFHYKHRFKSRAATIAWLLDWALDQKPVPERREQLPYTFPLGSKGEVAYAKKAAAAKTRAKRKEGK